MYIPNHAVHKILIKYAQENLSEQWLGGMFSTLDQLYSETENTHIMVLPTFLKNSCIHTVCIQTWLLDRSLDEMRDLMFS